MNETPPDFPAPWEDNSQVSVPARSHFRHSWRSPARETAEDISGVADWIDRNGQQAIALLEYYSFELEETTTRGFAAYWLDEVPSEWLRLAVLEALYQGRYKAVSVSQILVLWGRKRQPQIHFGGDFERLICDRLFSELDTELNTRSGTEAGAAPNARLKTKPNAESGSDSDSKSDPEPDGRLDSEDNLGEAAIVADIVDPVAPRPAPIAEFTPEGESPVYDKLRTLARSGIWPDPPSV